MIESAAETAPNLTRHERDELVRRNCAWSVEPVAAMVTLFYSMVAVAHMIVLPPFAAQTMAVVAAVTVAVSAAIWLYCRGVPVDQVKAPQVLIAIMTTMMLANMCIHMWLLGDHFQTTHLALVLVGVGVLLQSRLLFAALCVLYVGAWLVVMSLLPPSPYVLHFSFLMLTAVAVAVAANVIRYRITLAQEKERLASEREREQLMRSMRHAQKLEAIGVLAGGIAHDYNNLLTAVMGNLSLAVAQADEAGRRHLDNAMEASVRCAELTRSLLTYAGRATLEFEHVDFDREVGALVPLMQTATSSGVVLEVQGADEEVWVRADRGQLQQVLMNLVINAAESYGDGAGVVEVGLECREIDNPDDLQLVGASRLRPGQYAVVSVSDHGAGIDDETRERIFDPFFSTKNSAHAGRGLGLAAVVGIVRAHGGGIQMTSVVGSGSKFEVFLPVVDAAPTAAVVRAVRAPGEIRVLAVDDRTEILDVVRETLSDAGNTVVAFSDPEKAMQVILTHIEDFDLALLDIAMPKLDGFALLKEIRRRGPAVRVILMSGYDPTAEADRVLNGDPDLVFLRKPFVAEELLTTVQAALGEQANGRRDRRRTGDRRRKAG